MPRHCDNRQSAAIHARRGESTTQPAAPVSRLIRTGVRLGAAGAAMSAVAYAAYVGVAWARYGHVRPALPERTDSMLDRFLPA